MVKSMNTEDLFYDAKFVHNLAFHQYHKYLEQEIKKYCLLKTKNADPDRFLGREHELKDYNGVKLYLDVSELSQLNQS